MFLYLLGNWDVGLFFLVNRGLQNPLFDLIMPLVTNLDYWRIPLFIGWSALIIWGGVRGRRVAILAVIALTISDQLSSNYLKTLVGRIRPCNQLDGVRLLVNCTRSCSFPSSHASNVFSMTTLLSAKYRNLTYVFLTIAVVVGYSRVYVGVHYPSDVLGGAILGIICAIIVLVLEQIVTNVLRELRSGRSKAGEG